MNDNRQPIRLLLAIGFVLTLVQVADAQPRIPEIEELKNQPITDAYFHLPVDEKLGAEIDRLIRALDAPEYTEREAATEALISIGATAYAKLRDAYRASDGLEPRLKIEEIVKASFMSQHVFSKTGFLGMQQNTRTPPPSHDEDERIPEGTYGIRIGRIVPNTGAERAGLMAEDIIIEVDGLPHPGVGAELFANFSARIRRTGPGGQLHLTILRPGDGVFEVTVTLGPVPRSSYNSVTGMREIVPVVNERFNIWWDRFFIGNETEPVPAP